MNADLRKSGCVNHSFCESVMDFRYPKDKPLPDCELAACEGSYEADADEDAPTQRLAYSTYHIPNVAEHFTFDDGRIIAVCSSCMRYEVQNFPPDSQWRGTPAKEIACG